MSTSTGTIANAAALKLRAQCLLLSVVAVWGATFVVVKGAIDDASPFLFNLLRMAIAFASLSLIYRRHLRHLTRKAIGAGAMVGACLAAGYQFQTTGLARTTPSKSAFITGLVVVLVPLFAAVPWLRSATMQRPRINAWAGAVLAFCGVVLLTTPAGVSFPGDFKSINLGDLLSLGCAAGFALHIIALAHTSSRIDLPQLATLQVGFCTLYMAICLPFDRHIYLHPTPRLLTALLVTGLLATALAFTVQSWAQQHLPAAQTALTLALEPVFAGITSFLVTGERLHARAAWGVALILGGIVLTELLTTAPPVTAHETV